MLFHVLVAAPLFFSPRHCIILLSSHRIAAPLLVRCCCSSSHRYIHRTPLLSIPTMSFSLMSKKLGTLLSQQMSRPTNAVVGTRAFVATTGKKNTLNRRDLAAAVAEEHELSLAQSERIVKSVFDTIVDVRNKYCCGRICACDLIVTSHSHLCSRSAFTVYVCRK